MTDKSDSKRNSSGSDVESEVEKSELEGKEPPKSLSESDNDMDKIGSESGISESEKSSSETEKADEESMTDDNKYIVDPTDRILIGSVKTNIGHTESAAGVAALIKVLLMMKNGQVVPSLHLKKDKSNLNKKIKLDEYGLDVALDVVDWPENEDGVRLCCVNSFGFGGSNSHAIIVQKPGDFHGDYVQHSEVDEEIPKVVCFSGVDKVALKNTLEIAATEITQEHDVRDISFTSAFHRDHHPAKTLVFGKSTKEIKDQIQLKIRNIDKLESNAKRRIIFVFCGVGTTWQGMCREMMDRDSVFKHTINAIDHHLSILAGWKIADKFSEDTDYSDPFLNHVAIFCTQVALASVWQSWGIIPDAIVGQSVGEVAAAYVSGALPLKDAVDVIYYRSKILAEMTGGKMMVVGKYPIEKTEAICESFDNKVTVAVYNSPSSGTLSGDADIMDKIKADLEQNNTNNNEDIMIRPLSVQCAYHSHHVEPCMNIIEDQLSHIEKGTRLIDHISTVTGELAQDDDFQTGKYWAENIRRPVKFKDAIFASSRPDCTNVYVEIGPRQVLRAHLANIMGDQVKGICVPSMNAKKEVESIYASLSTLYEMGTDVNMRAVIPYEGNVLPIPRYGFNKTKFLYVPETAQQMLKGITRNSDTHMYVRNNGGDVAEFKIQIDKDTTPFVFDHYFLNSLLVPGATYVEAALDVGERKTSNNAFELSVSTEFVNPFTPAEDKSYNLFIEVKEDSEIDGHLYFVNSESGRTLCKGGITHRQESERPQVDLAPIRSRCFTYRSKEDSYECLDRIDFNYGQTLSLIEQSWSSDTECLVEFLLPDSVKAETKNTHLHPSVIDAMFQTFAILSTIGAEGPTLPKGLGSIVINRPPQGSMFGYSQMVKATPVGNHYNSLLLSPEGNVIAEIQNFYTKTIRISDAPNQSIMYGMQWNQVDIPEEEEDSTDMTGKRIVFGSQRFIKCCQTIDTDNLVFHELTESLPDTETMFRLAFEQMSNMKAIIFANCQHVQTTKNSEVYSNAKNTFLSLALLIKVLRENNFILPVFVITEDVKSAPAIHKCASNICGGELWGMVRSAMGETAYNDLRIVDMALTPENAKALLNVTKDGFANHNEYIIDGGVIYHSEMNEAPDQDIEPNQREIDCEPTENLTLKSTNPAVVTDPHFRFKKQLKKNDAASSCQIRLNSICLHDSQLYPTSTVASDAEKTIWPEVDDNGFDVVCVEGVGWSCDKSRKGPKVGGQAVKIGFCFPVDVSTIVSVPSKCTFDISTMPSYTPGLVTVGVILFNIVEVCKLSPSVRVITDDRTSPSIQLLIALFSRNKKTVVTTDTVESLRGEPEDTYEDDAHTVVILTRLTNNHIQHLKKKYPDIQKIVSLEEYFPRYMQRWVQHNNKDLAVTVLNTERLFSQSELVEKVPKVQSWIKTLDNNTKNALSQIQPWDDDDNDQGLLTLPFPVLSVYEGKHSDNHIPLRVFRTEVFRPNGCYILVGGLTGLGWELLQVIAELGAGYIATLSRRPPSEEKQMEIKNIQNRFACRIIPVQADITDLNLLSKALTDLETQIGDAKIRGVFHGGGVVCDMILSNMTPEDAEKPLMPKILGTWNLHNATMDMPLDFFVMHSSIVSILGNPGQCNYAAGNSFQDSFAHYRRSLGLCGQSINWSTLSLGMATENKELEQNFRSQGFFYLSADDVRACFVRAVMTNPAQVTFGIFDWGRLEFHPTVKMYPYKFISLLDKYGSKNNGFKKLDSKYHFDFTEFSKLDGEGQRTMIVELLKNMIMDTFVAEESSLNEESKFVTLGIDSMEAMSFTNSIFETIQVRIPVVTLLSDSTSIGSLTNYILENIHNGSSDDNSIEPVREDITKQLEFIKGSVTFMQKSLLGDFLKNPHSKNFMRQADYEVTGLKLKVKDWRVILNHLLKMNPELRTIYKLNKEDQIYESVLLPAEDVEVDMELVAFDSICNDDTTDDRDKIFFDLTKDLPVRFKIACKKEKTRMRMYIHSVISDLSGVAMLFRDIGSYMKPYILNEELPSKDTNVVPAEAVRSALTPRMSEMRQYWRLQLNQDIKPFTFGNDIEEELDPNNWYQIKEDVPSPLVEKMMNYIQKGGMSLFNFIVSTYMVLLHQKTKLDLIPLVTNVDMRGHVPQLRSFVTRCINAIPVIGDLKNMGTVGEYMKRNSDRLHHMTRQGGFPYKLSEDEMQSDELRKQIGRHRLVMDNMANMNQTFKHKRVTIKLSNVFHTRYVYETTLYVLYDLQQNKVALEYGYNIQCVPHGEAMNVPMQIMQLMTAFVDMLDTPVTDILEGNVALPDVERPLKPSGEIVKNMSSSSLDNYDLSVETVEAYAPMVEKIRRSFSGESGMGAGQGLLLLRSGMCNLL